VISGISVLPILNELNDPRQIGCEGSKRLYDAIENGIADVSDPMLKERVSELKAIRDQDRVDAERAEGALDRLGPSITPQALHQSLACNHWLAIIGL
jgi:hypothetical protein